MAKIQGTNVAAPLAPFTTDDQFPTHDAKYGKGGQREVATIAERDAIPSARLTEGCTCYVAATEKTYRWKSNAWVDDTPQGSADASGIAYTPSGSGNTPTNVAAALDSLNAKIPNAVTSVIANNELVLQTTDGQSVKGKVGITTGADGLLHLTLTDEEGHTYSSPIAGLRVVGNALQYSNDGETWTTVQTFGKLAIKYVQASDPTSGDEGDLALVGSTNAYVLKVYVGGSWVSVCDFGTLDLTSDGITMVGENKTLTEKMAEVVDASISSLDTEGRIPRTVTNSYWTYENDQPVSTAGDGKTFKACVVDVTGFNALLLNFYLLASYGAKSFFTNEDDVMVGSFLTKNTTTYQKFYIPEGATKLYLTNDVRQVSSLGIIGLNEHTAISLLEDMTKKVESPSSDWIQGSVKGAINGSTYAKYDSWSYPKFIPITDGADEIIVKTDTKGAVVAFVTNTTMSNGGAVPYAEGETGTYSLLANGTHLLKVPSGAKYLHCSQGNNTQVYPLSVVCRFSLMSQVRDIVSGIEADVDELSDRLEDLGRSVYENAEVDSSKWTNASFKGSISSGNYVKYDSWDYPKFIPIEYAKKVVLTTGEKKALYTFVTTKDGATQGSSVPFADGVTGVSALNANGTYILDVPSDAKYIFAAQKISENWQFPTSVVCKYTADTKVEELEERIYEELDGVDEKKQDKVYLRDLSDGNIREGYDLINASANAKRVCIQNRKCYKGDIIKTVPNAALGHSSQMLVRVYNKSMAQISQTTWVLQYTIPEDGYYIAVVESAADNGGTRELFLASVAHYTPIEANTERVLSERWENGAFDKTIKRLTFDNGYKVYPYIGESPNKNTVRMKYFGTLSGAGNQSMAFYGNYIFTFGKGVAVVIFDLAFNKVGQISAIEATNRVECNAAYFSNEFYAEGDEFPIVYVEAIYTSPYIVGYRITRNNGVWSVEKVHEIRNEVGHGNLVIYDKQNDDLIITGAPSANQDNYLYRYHRPQYAESSDGVSIIPETDLVSTVLLSNDLVDYYAVMKSGQDKSVYGNVAFGLTNDMSDPLNNRLFGVDLTTGKTVFFLPFAWSGEAECLEWYCGRLYFKDANNRFYEIIIDAGSVEPFSAGTRRPTNPVAGYSMFDTSLGKPIWYTGSGWVDASGQSV